MADIREYDLYIDGRFTGSTSEQTVTSIDPSTGEEVARLPKPTAKDARRAIEAARKAADAGTWSGMSPEARRDALMRVCDLLDERQALLAELEAREAGLTIRNASGSAWAAIAYGRELIDIAAKVPPVEPLPHNEFPTPHQSLLVREPYGVATAIVPFNQPLNLAAWKLFPALATGNTVVLKSSPFAASSLAELARAFHEAELPPGVLNVIHGGGADVGEELVTNPMVDRVAFTGSTETGRRIMALAASTVKKVTLELGGKSPVLVLDDADLDLAIAGILWGVYLHSGQVCQAGSRVFVPAALHDEIVERIVGAATQLHVGPAMSWETDLGPLVSQQQLQRVERYVELGRKDGATLVCGGHRLTDDGLADGNFFAPTVFTDVPNESRIAQEEIFGPVLSILRYDRVDDAVRMANETIYGLAAAIWSADVPRALQVARRIQAGTIWINDHHLLVPTAPYAGMKQSGMGTELGETGVLEYLRAKHVWVGQERQLKSKVWPPVIGLDRVFDISYE